MIKEIENSGKYQMLVDSIGNTIENARQRAI
jgi:hypothetical protein